MPPVLIGSGCRGGWLGRWCHLRRLALLIHSARPDVIHVFSHASEIPALVAVLLAGHGKVLGVRRNCGYWHTPSMLWRTRITQLFRPEYAANSEAAKSVAVKTERVPRDRITVIRNPVSSRRLKEGLRAVPPPAALGIGHGEKVVGIVANLRPIKDHATFLRAGRLVLSRFPQTRFLSVGEPMGETIRGLRALSDSLGMSGRVAWLGAVPNPVSLLPHFHVGVLSSLSESLSNALVEYAAVGLPTVATDVGGTREVVIDGQTGFLVPPRSPEQMAERICQLLANETLRRTLGENARRRVLAHFSERVVLQQYIDLYSRLAGQ